MDKWDEIIDRVQKGILAEEPEAALAGGLQLLAEFGRTLETVSADLDRIATVMERGNIEISGDEGIPPELEHIHDIQDELEHDL